MKGEEKMPAKVEIPEYGTVMRGDKLLFRTTVTDENGKRITILGNTREEVYKKEKDKRKTIEEALYRKAHPTVADYCEKWLLMKSATVRPNTINGYRRTIEKYIVKPIGTMYMEEVTADDLKLLMVPFTKKSKAVYENMNMLVKSIFRSALESNVILDNPAVSINPRGGQGRKKREPLTDEQVRVLLDTIRDQPPYVFVMIGLYAGLRREEILGLQWDCVFLDDETPYIAVRRAWRSENNRPSVTTILKTPHSRRDVPIPACLVNVLREQKEKSNSIYVISDSEGMPLAASQYVRMWNYIRTRSALERKIYRYVNGRRIHTVIKPKVGDRCRTNKEMYYTIDFVVTPHMLRHTYITNLIYAGVDPKTVQYLAGHENSKVTMDIYAKVKYNKPWELAEVINKALAQKK